MRPGRNRTAGPDPGTDDRYKWIALANTTAAMFMFFSLMIAGLASSLPNTLTSGLQHHGVPYGVAHQVATLPPVSAATPPPGRTRTTTATRPALAQPTGHRRRTDLPNDHVVPAHARSPGRGWAPNDLVLAGVPDYGVVRATRPRKACRPVRR